MLRIDYACMESSLHLRICHKIYVIASSYLYSGRAKRKDVFEHAQNAQIQIYPKHAQSLIRAFALHWYIL